MTPCGMYWASHRCDLEAGHFGDHACLESGDCGARFPCVPPDARNINPNDMRMWPDDYSLPG